MVFTRINIIIITFIKAKAYYTYIAPQAAYRSCSGAFVSQSAGIQQAKLVSTNFNLQPNSHTQPWSAVYGLHLRNPRNYMDYYSFTDPEGMEGWVGLVGWPMADMLPTMSTIVQA